MELTVNIYDEFVGDVEVPCDVIGDNIENDVFYDEDALALKLEMLEVPELIDKDVREKAIDTFMYDPDTVKRWEEAQEESRLEAQYESYREKDL